MCKIQSQRSRGEQGQMLVLIILVIIVLFGFAALAIDGGLVFSNRRAAQNAADAAALAAAYAKCQGGNPVTSAISIADTNGFKNNGADVQVAVNNPPSVGPYATNTSYFEVVITTVTKPVFSQFVTSTPLTSTVRSVSHCKPGVGGGTTQPGLGGEVAILALNKTASSAFSNVGGAGIYVDGGVVVNSTANDAVNQNGSAVLQMNWAKIRGGANVGGSFGIYGAGTSAFTKEIDVVKDFNTSGAGAAIAGAFNIGGNVTNTASINMTGYPLNIGGYFKNSGAGTIVAEPFVVVGNVDNIAGGSITAKNMVIGGSYTASGNASASAPSGGTLNATIVGNVDLSGSAKVNGNVTMQGSYTTSGTGAITGNRTTSTTLTKPTVKVTIPEMSDPLASLVNPPTLPTTACINKTFQNWGTIDSGMVSGAYYCSLDFGGSLETVIPPGTYWTDKFSLTGNAKVKMDGVNLYITGKNATTAFERGGSTSISMVGTMVYIKSGAFTYNGGYSDWPLNWTAPGSGTYTGMALYMDRSNTAKVAMTGGTIIKSVSGTWYAPASACSFTGNTSNTVYAQFICDTVAVDGSSKLTIKYDSTLVYQQPSGNSPSEVSLDE